MSNEDLAAQVRAMKTTEKWRTKWRALEIVCGGCGDPLAEVMKTHPEQCVVIALPQHNPDAWAKFRALQAEPGFDMDAEVAALNDVLRLRRRGSDTQVVEWRLIEEMGGRSEGIHLQCGCRSVKLDSRVLLSEADAGTRRLVLPAN